MSHNPEIWLGALATLALYSILYRENPVYRVAEHLFMGLGAGYGVYVIWRDVLLPKWWTPLTTGGQWWWIFALIAGGMYYTLYFKRLSWMSRLVMLTTMGFTAGQAFRLWAGLYVKQISSAMNKPLFYALPRGGTVHAAAPGPILLGRIPPPYIHLDNLLFVVILVAVLTYFLFSFEHQSLLVRRTAQAGRWVMMIGFGAIFGSTVMARLSLFIGRLLFLFRDWIHWIPR
jgi:hypothetical protein